MAINFVAYLTTKSQIALVGSILGFGFIGANSAQAATISLGAAAGYAVLGSQAVTNTGNSVITGNLGVFAGTSVTGFPIVSGTTYTGSGAIANPIAFGAMTDARIAYTALAALAHTTDLTSQLQLGGTTRRAGVYFFGASTVTLLEGILTLDAQNNSDARFVFQMEALTTASNSSVRLIDGADARNVFFQVRSSATLGTGTQFQGNILAHTSIVVQTNASIKCGSALGLGLDPVQSGNVTLDNNEITACSSRVAQPIPEPLTIVGTLIGATAAFHMRKKLKPASKVELNQLC